MYHGHVTHTFSADLTCMAKHGISQTLRSFVTVAPDWRAGPLGISKRHHGALASNVAFGDPPACLLSHPDDDALQAVPGGPAHPSCGHSYHI